MMPGYLGDPEALGIKIVTVYPGNHGSAYDSHQGVVLLFGSEYGNLLAIIDASSITAIRTAAVSGVATQLLANEEAGDLAILGSGVQAQTHLDAMRAARPIRRVRVYSPNPDHLQTFVERETGRQGMEIEAAASAREAVTGADLICTTTSAREPVLMGDWIGTGAHINAAGSSVAFTRELDTTAVARARLFVDRRESTVNEAGDFLIPRKEGAIGDDHILGELGEILLGQNAGRTGVREITLFKSLGLAVEDVASAHYIYHQALERGMGTRIEFGGDRYVAPQDPM
jgi:ornithine cyclodeaminase